MALVNCRECSEQVSDSAPTCPRCGVVSPGGESTLEVRRAKQFNGALVPVVVLVDNEEIAWLVPNKSFDMRVSPGSHRVECGYLGAGPDEPTVSTAQDFRVPAGQKLVITVSLSGFRRKPQFSEEIAEN